MKDQFNYCWNCPELGAESKSETEKKLLGEDKRRTSGFERENYGGRVTKKERGTELSPRNQKPERKTERRQRQQQRQKTAFSLNAYCVPCV